MKSHNPQSTSNDLNCEDFVDLMQLIIDGEASDAEKQYFEEHGQKYYPCVHTMKYQQAMLMLIKNCIKNDCRCRQTLPNGLAEIVRNKVHELSDSIA
jgi:hypothetical protein